MPAHFHISTEFMFFGGLLVIGLILAIGYLVFMFRKPKEIYVPGPMVERTIYKHSDNAPGAGFDGSTAARVTGSPIGPYTSRPYGGYAGGGMAAPAVVQSPTVIHDRGGSDMLTGVVVGSLLSGGHDRGGYSRPNYDDRSYSSGGSSGSGGGGLDYSSSGNSSSSDSGGFSYDSGSSSSSDGGSSSSD